MSAIHYYVVGVNGSGKSALVSVVREQTDMSVVHGTTALMDYLNIPGDYNALRKMDQAKALVAWGETAEKLAKDYKDRSLLLDTHILNLTQGKIIRRDGPWIAKYDALVLVTAPTDIILERIEANSSKDRAMFAEGLNTSAKLKQLAEYQAVTLRTFEELAKRYKLPAVIIDNSSDLQASVKAFLQFHQQQNA